MSANHKRPLLAFVLVALACSLIVANGIRSQAVVVSVVRAGAQQLVAGVELVLTDEPRESTADDAEPEVTPVGPVQVAAQQVFGGAHFVPPAPHRTTTRHHAKVHHTHARNRGKQHGHAAPDRAHGKSHHQQPGKLHGKKLHGKDHTKKLGKGHTKDHGKSNGKGHAKKH
ncbi:MAG TPA: hypothetical protein VFT00_09650 [Nocardioides sp.]|nr:hypothetical protein [Nocardioides sp.]